MLKHARLNIHATSKQQRGARLLRVRRVLSSRLHLPMDENWERLGQVERLVPHMGTDPPKPHPRAKLRQPSCGTVHSLCVSRWRESRNNVRLFVFNVLEACDQTKDTLPRACLNVWVKCQQPASKALDVEGPIGNVKCLTPETMTLYLLYTGTCQHVRSASSEHHVASQNCSSICPNLKACSCAISDWMAWCRGTFLSTSAVARGSRSERPHSSTDAPVSALGRPGTGGVGGLRKVSHHGTFQSHWARMLALTVLDPYHQTLERCAVQ